MKKILFLSYLLLSSNLAWGQANYIDYHKEVRAIEAEILDSAHTEAVQSYKELFDDYDFVFAEDCFRAAQTAIFIQDSINAFLFLDRAVCQGVSKEWIINDSLLIDLKQLEYWSTFERNYDSLRNVYLSKIDWELREKVNTLYDLDQKYRDKHELHPWNFMWRPLIWAKWKKTTTHIVENELIPLIKTHGFPNEKLIGVDEAKFHHKQTRDHLKSNYAFIILVHYYSIPRKTDYNELFLSEIEKGNLHPRVYGSIIDFQAAHGKNKYYKGLHYNEWHKSKDKTQFELISKNRVDIGLETLEVQSKKYERGRKACKQREKGNYKHIRFWLFCG